MVFIDVRFLSGSRSAKAVRVFKSLQVSFYVRPYVDMSGWERPLHASEHSMWNLSKKHRTSVSSPNIFFYRTGHVSDLCRIRVPNEQRLIHPCE
jgi:hypothetical protein